MQKQAKRSIGVLLLFVTQFWLVSCAGGHVSGNGIFENGHKELKESLVGSWRVINPEKTLVGDELYTFYMDEKNKRIRLKVEGKERVMTTFDSLDGLSFSFEYVDGEGDRVFVVGQFKSSLRESLVMMREPVSKLKASMGGSISLQKRQTETKTVVASTGKN